MTRAEEVVVLDEATGGAAVAELEAKIRRLTGDIELLREQKRQAETALEKEERDVEYLGRIVASAGDELATYDPKGQERPITRKHQLERRTAGLAELRKGIQAFGRKIADTEAERGRAETERNAIQMGPVRELQELARHNAALAQRVERAASELGRLLREMAENERVMAALVNSDRARNALSVTSLKVRLAYALFASNAFALDPDAPGERGRALFFKIEDIDPTSAWRGRSLVDICVSHYEEFIREACRVRAG